MNLGWLFNDEDSLLDDLSLLRFVLDDVFEEVHDVGSTDESSVSLSVFVPLGIEGVGAKVGFDVVSSKLVDINIELEDALGNSSGLVSVKRVLSGKGIFGGTACTLDNLDASFSQASNNNSLLSGVGSLVVTNSSDLGEEALVMSVKSIKILNMSGDVRLELDDLKGLIDDNLLEEWNDSNSLLKSSLLLFKNRDLVHVNTDLDVELFVLIHELLNLHLVNVDFVQSLLELVVVVLETFDVDFPLLVLLEVSDELVVLVLEVVVVVGASVKLRSQFFAVVNESVENIHFWREATSSGEAVKNISDSLLLL